MAKKTIVTLLLALFLAGCGPETIIAAIVIYDIEQCKEEGGTWEFGECTLPGEEGYTGVTIIERIPVEGAAFDGQERGPEAY